MANVTRSARARRRTAWQADAKPSPPRPNPPARDEHELQDLFEEASVGLLLLSREGRILRSNRALSEILGQSTERLKGRALTEFHPDAAELRAMLRLLTERQRLHGLPTEFRAAKGQSRHVLVDADALWENGRFIHSRWFVRDISRRKELERELLELSERERRRFAQELHDGLGQQLGGVAYLSNVLREKLAERGAPEAGEAERIFALVRDAIEQTRRIARGLSPIQGEGDGLVAALDELAAQTTELFHVPCRFECRDRVRLEDATIAGHLYRIAQEAVNNALKHGNPRRLGIRLQRHGHDAVLTVTDDGKGIGALSPKRQGLGLHIMQYRAGLLRGTVTVRPRRGGGTEVVCTAPYPKAGSSRSRA